MMFGMKASGHIRMFVLYRPVNLSKAFAQAMKKWPLVLPFWASDLSQM